MKSLTNLVIKVLIFSLAILILSFNSSLMAASEPDINKLTDCLALTSNVNSLEVDLSSATKGEGQTAGIKMQMNMKIEDLKGDLKGKITIDLSGQHQEFYLGVKNGKASIYLKDNSGKYSVESLDVSQLGEMDMTKSFKAYIEIINSDPGIVKKTSKTSYQLNIPKEKIFDYYYKISGETPPFNFETLIIEFIIGDDGYLQNVNLKANVASMSLDMNTKYINYNQKFNIVLPGISN